MKDSCGLTAFGCAIVSCNAENFEFMSDLCSSVLEQAELESAILSENANGENIFFHLFGSQEIVSDREDFYVTTLEILQDFS